MYGFSKETVILYDLRMVGFDHAFIGPVVGMDGQFPHNDQPATSSGAPRVVGHMAIREGPPPAEVCSVSQKTNAVGQRHRAYLDRAEKKIKHD